MKKLKITYIYLGIITLGIFLLGYSGYEIINGKIQVKNSINTFEKLQKTKNNVKINNKKTIVNTEKSDVLGLLINNRLDVSIPVVEDTSNDQLKKGAGHYKNSKIPPSSESCFLFGHRDTVFSCLQYVQIGDEFLFKTINGDFKYKVINTRITSIDSEEILKNYGKNKLIMVTCYPFNYVGSAPKRFIVICEKNLKMG